MKESCVSLCRQLGHSQKSTSPHMGVRRLEVLPWGKGQLGACWLTWSTLPLPLPGLSRPSDLRHPAQLPPPGAPHASLVEESPCPFPVGCLHPDLHHLSLESPLTSPTPCLPPLAPSRVHPDTLAWRKAQPPTVSSCSRGLWGSPATVQR